MQKSKNYNFVVDTSALSHVTPISTNGYYSIKNS